MSRNLIYISYKLDSRVGATERQLLDCLLTFGDQTLEAVINIYPSNKTLAERLNTSVRTIIRSKNNLETLGIIVRYYDEVKHQEAIKVPFEVLDKYMRDKLVKSEVTKCHTLVSLSTTKCHTEVTKCHTTLHIPILNSSTVNQKEELLGMSEQKADPEYIDKCLKVYKIPIEDLTNAIQLINGLKLNAIEYNKYLSIAVCKLRNEKMSIEEATKAVVSKLKAHGNHRAQPPTKISLSSEQIVEYGLNYNANFGTPYIISKDYLYAKNALEAAGVRYEIR